MDFHGLPRRDLQFLCKKNKIPANITNVAMADALSSLEIVEGLDEYMNQSDSNAPRSPTTVAKQPPNTSTRTTRRKTTVKAVPQPSSQLVPRSCHLTSETDQENVNKNVAQEPNTSSVKLEANVAKTLAARSTRKASVATSCTSNVQERKKDESVQSVYNTRKSTRLLEKFMGDLSLKTNKTLDEDLEQKVSAQEKNPSGSEEKSKEAEFIAGRDLSASMEKEWKLLKNDDDHVVGDLEIHVGLGTIAVSDANTERTIEKTNETMGDEKESENSLVQLDKQEETVQVSEAICEEGPKKNDNDQERGDLAIYVIHGELPVLECANTEANNDNNEVFTNVLAFDGSVQLDQQEAEQAIQENGSESENINNSGEDILMDQTQVEQPETEHLVQEKDYEPEEINNVETVADPSEIELEDDNSGVDSDDTISGADFQTEKTYKSDEDILMDHKSDEDILMDQTQVEQPETERPIQAKHYEPDEINNVDTVMDPSETEPEEDNSCVDSDDTITEADSQTEKINKPDEDILVDQAHVDQPGTEHPIQEKDYVPEEINNVETMADQSEIEPEDDNSGVDSDDTISEADSQTEKANKSDQTQVDQPETKHPIQEKDYEPEEINNVDTVAYQSEIELEEDNSGVDSDETISEADSNQAVVGSDIADEDVLLSESEVSAAAPTSPRLLEEAKVKTTSLSPFAAESISIQFPRPNKTTTTPLKKSAMKLVTDDKENDKELMMNVNNNDNGESKGENKMKKKKKVEIDEENLKEVSIRQLVKMVKKLSIKNSNRTALQILPGNNQIAE